MSPEGPKKPCVAELGDAGFTLFELLIVLAVVSLAYLVVAPSFNAPKGASELRVAALDVFGAARRARGAAIASGEPVDLWFDIAGKRYGVGSRERGQQMPGGIAIQVRAARELRDGRGRIGIRFFTDGSSTGGTIDLAADGKLARLGIDWLTGAVRLEGL